MVEQTTLFGDENISECYGIASAFQYVIIEKMTADELNNSLLSIQYNFNETQFGEILIASTIKGICFLSFVDDKTKAVQDLTSYCPTATIEQAESSIHKTALQAIDGESLQDPIILHIKATEFQVQIWRKLLEIRTEKLTSYSHLAKSINKPKASRAVGTAIGSNPIAYLIPCHRVVQSNGSLGGYRWGLKRKSDIISWEVKRN